MRTMLDIDDDVLAAVHSLARQQNRTVGEVLSALARDALAGAGAVDLRGPEVGHGFRAFPSNGKTVTNDLIDALENRVPV